MELKNTAIYELIGSLGAEPAANLNMLAGEVAAEAGAQDCLIVSDGVVLASASGSLCTPVEDCGKIPLIGKRWQGGYSSDRRNAESAHSSVKDWLYMQPPAGLPPGTERFEALTALITDNIEGHRIYLNASTDKLTGALNRKYLDMAIDSAFEKAKQDGNPLSVIICDLDYFKHVNDTYGHMTGDEVLRDTAALIRGAISGKGVLGRYGGEEFVVLLENTSADEACDIAECIRQTVQDARVLGDKREVTLSLGTAAYPGHAATRKALIEKADKALYVAKKSGRNRYMIWSEDIDDTVITKNIAHELISGDTAKDAGYMMALFALLDIAVSGSRTGTGPERALDIILDAAGAEFAALLPPDTDEPVCAATAKYMSFERKRVYNRAGIDEAKKTGEPMFFVDWDNETADEAGMADWLSTAIAPCIKNGGLKGILYLTVSVKEKEFTGSESGFIANAASLVTALL